MSVEREPSAVIDSDPEAEGESDAIQLLDSLKVQAQEDSDLMGKYEEIIDGVGNYAIAKIRHVRYSESNTARSHLGEKYYERFNTMNEDQNKAHNRLIGALGGYADRSKSLGHKIKWWDGRDGLAKDTVGRMTRQRIDDWAMDVWLTWEDERDDEEKETKGGISFVATQAFTNPSQGLWELWRTSRRVQKAGLRFDINGG